MKSWKLRLVAKVEVVLVIAAAIIMCAGTVFATTIQYTGIDSTSENTGIYLFTSLGAINTVAGSYQLSIDGAAPISGVCVDPAGAPLSAQTYTISSITAGTAYAKAAYLLSLANSTNAAAVQIAVWKTVWPAMGTSVYSWTTNNSGLDSQLSGQVSSLLAQLTPANLSAFDLSIWKLASNGGYGGGFQDYIFDPPVPGTPSVPGTAPVPEPATMLLLGSGLVGVAAIRRRARK